MDVRINFPHSSMVAIAAAYILLPTAAPGTTINVVARGINSPVRLFPQKEMKSIAISSTVLGIFLMLCKSPWPEIGLVIALCGGTLCMGVGIGVILGLCNHREIHLKEVMSSQRQKMVEVLEEYGIDAGKADEVQGLVEGRTDSVSFQSTYGTWMTERVGDGYIVKLYKGEQVVERAELVRGTDMGEDIGWTETVRPLVGPAKARLLDMYA